MENQEMRKRMVSKLPFLENIPETMEKVMGRIKCDVTGITDSVYKITASSDRKTISAEDMKNNLAAIAEYSSTFKKELDDLGKSLQKFLDNCGVEKFSDIVAVDKFPDTQDQFNKKDDIKRLLAHSLGYAIGNFSDVGNKKTANNEVIDMIIKSKAFAHAVDLDIIPEIAFRSVGVSEERQIGKQQNKELTTQFAIDLMMEYNSLKDQSQATGKPRGAGDVPPIGNGKNR